MTSIMQGSGGDVSIGAMAKDEWSFFNTEVESWDDQRQEDDGIPQP